MCGSTPTTDCDTLVSLPPFESRLVSHQSGAFCSLDYVTVEMVICRKITIICRIICLRRAPSETCHAPLPLHVSAASQPLTRALVVRTVSILYHAQISASRLNFPDTG